MTNNNCLLYLPLFLYPSSLFLNLFFSSSHVPSPSFSLSLSSSISLSLPPLSLSPLYLSIYLSICLSIYINMWVSECAITWLSEWLICFSFCWGCVIVRRIWTASCMFSAQCTTTAQSKCGEHRKNPTTRGWIIFSICIMATNINCLLLITWCHHWQVIYTAVVYW